MRLLLDTNIYVYLVSDIEALTQDVRAILEDYDHLKYLSIVSLQELVIAYRTKGLLSNIWKNESEMIEFIIHDPSVAVDNIDEHVIRSLAAMEINEEQDHKDPFDHLIIAQAISHKMTLVSSDSKFHFYRNQGLELIENR
jgi:PIN domain nuclease of toxin-antitoxin system